MHCIPMAAKIVQRSVEVITLLVLSTRLNVAVTQDEYERKMLLGLFETALLNDNDVLWTLQEIFFNPDSKQSPENVCLSVSISVEDIADPVNKHCDDYSDNPEMSQAFIYDDLWRTWYFNSYYELQQQVDDGESDTQELINLIKYSGSTSIFYSFDPSFYSIMQTLSSSIVLMFPNGDDSDYSNDYAQINIAISTRLDENPCWDDVVYALGDQYSCG